MKKVRPEETAGRSLLSIQGLTGIPEPSVDRR
jgi:hypothetical protein